MRWFLGGSVFAIAAYASYVGFTWCRYGQTTRIAKNAKDNLLDEVLPVYEVAEHQQIRVAASADRTFRVACNLRLFNSRFVRAIFRTREFVLGGTSQDNNPEERGLLDQATAWGWSMLAEQSGHEIVFGAITQPWVANPVFRGLSSAEFQKFQEPGFVKIAWTLRTDPLASESSIASTETRVASTDAAARAKFRRYWAFLSPGIILIRLLALRRVRTEAERLQRMPSVPTELAG
jgi:hypothetical protein